MTVLDRGGRLIAAWVLLLALPAVAIRSGLPEDAGVGFSAGQYLRQVGPALGAVLLPALCAAWLATGAAGVGAALRRLSGDRSEARAALAARALATAARGALGAGLVLSLAALVLLGAAARATLEGGAYPAPAFVARGISAGLMPALWALLFGRCWLGTQAARAAADAGQRHGPTLRGWSELAVPLLLVVLQALLLLSTHFPFPTLPR